MKGIIAILVAISLAVGCSMYDSGVAPPPPNTPTSTISGSVKVDGTGLGNVVVSLTGPISSRTTSTGVNGNYSFTGLDRLGDYKVSMANPYSQLYSFVVTSKNTSIQSIGNYEANFSGTAITASPPSATPLKATIVGLVWLDTNNNKQRDSGEPAFVGLTMILSGAVSRQTTTDSNGRYAFTNLDAGSYAVAQVNPSADLYRFDSESTDGRVSVGINDSNGTVFTADFRAVRK